MQMEPLHASSPPYAGKPYVHFTTELIGRDQLDGTIIPRLPVAHPHASVLKKLLNRNDTSTEQVG